MSDDLLEPETPAVSPPKAGPNPASILAVILVLTAIAGGIYVGSFWYSHNSRVDRLKAKQGDFIQRERWDLDEDLDPVPVRDGEIADAEKKPAEPLPDPNAPMVDPMQPDWYDTYITQLFPRPVQVIYWKNPELKPEDVALILEFKDLDTLSVRCDEIDGATIQKLLDVPKLRSLRIQSKKLDVSGIKNWKAQKKLRNITLVNPDWDRPAMRQLIQDADENETLKDKVDATNKTGPSFG